MLSVGAWLSHSWVEMMVQRQILALALQELHKLKLLPQSLRSQEFCFEESELWAGATTVDCLGPVAKGSGYPGDL